MKVQIHPTIYVMGASCELMDKVRANTNSWAEGNENICMMFEEAIEIEELKPLLNGIKDGGDVILSL